MRHASECRQVRQGSRRSSSLLEELFGDLPSESEGCSQGIGAAPIAADFFFHSALDHLRRHRYRAAEKELLEIVETMPDHPDCARARELLGQVRALLPGAGLAGR